MAPVAVELASVCFFSWDSRDRAVSCALLIDDSSELRAAILRRTSSSSPRAFARSLFTSAVFFLIPAVRAPLHPADGWSRRAPTGLSPNSVASRTPCSQVSPCSHPARSEQAAAAPGRSTAAKGRNRLRATRGRRERHRRAGLKAWKWSPTAGSSRRWMRSVHSPRRQWVPGRSSPFEMVRFNR